MDSISVTIPLTYYNYLLGFFCEIQSFWKSKAYNISDQYRLGVTRGGERISGEEPFG